MDGYRHLDGTAEELATIDDLINRSGRDLDHDGELVNESDEVTDKARASLGQSRMGLNVRPELSDRERRSGERSF